MTGTGADSDGPVTTPVAIEVTNVIELTAVTGPVEVSVAENSSTRVASFSAASEEDRDGVGWIITGADRAHFTLDGPAGALRFEIDPVAPNSFPLPSDFEDRDDSNTGSVDGLSLLALASGSVSAP